MSRNIGGVPFIFAEPDSECSRCHAMRECRPYGPNGESICYGCANATPEDTAQTERMMRSVLFREVDEK